MLRKTAPLLGLCMLGACCPTMYPPLEVVEDVNLERYAGLWYEIARYPVIFQTGCVGVTAEYTLQDDGTVQVINRCREGTLDGAERRIEGTARVPDPEVPGKLKVSFFPPFESDYYIIDLDEDYQWAVVGSPNRSILWILSRTPTLDETLYNDILSRLPDKDYDPARLELTPQPPGG